VGKRFFISHASSDKPLALELKEELEGDAWVDLHELDVGDLLLEEISAGIDEATDFVLLWSAASSISKWVRFEFHMAFIKYLEDSAAAIRVVRLDETAVPLYLRPFLQARGHGSGTEIASSIRGNSPAPRPRRLFFNRHSEIDRIERALYDPAVASVFICGVPGVGKRSLAREALTRVTKGAGAFIRVKVAPGTAEPELNLLVASELRVDPAPEGSEIDAIVANTSRLLKRYAENGGIWLFEDAEHWLNDDGTLGRIAKQVVDAVTPAIGPGVVTVFTSRRKPARSDGGTAVESFFVRGLSSDYAVPLLRGIGAAGTDADLALVAEELDGHPLALEIVSPRLPLDLGALRDQRISIATDLVDPGRLAPATWRALEVLALADGPITGEDLGNFLSLSSDEFQAAVSQASQYSLVEYDDSGSLSLHALLRDYFLRAFRKQPDHVERTGKLADLLKARFEKLQPENVMYVPSLLSTVKVLGLAGRFDEARALRRGLIGTLYQTAVELYQEKRYAEAIQYLDEALTGSDDIDLEVQRFRVKTLAYLGRLDEARLLGDQLVAQHPYSPSVLRDRGRVEFIARNWTDAIRYFERAIPYRRNPAQLWSDIAQARARLEDWTGAVAAARTAIDLKGDTPWTLALYSEALERLGEMEEAEQVMSQAVAREPANPAYRHRLGRIALLMGDRPLAINQFRESVALDPRFVQSWLSLASALADAGELVAAQEALDEGSAVTGAPIGVVDNVRAKILLVEGKTEEAASAIGRALAEQRDVQNLSLAVRIWIARAESGAVSIGQARAQVRSLSRELDAAGGLQHVYEYSQEFPQYFGSE
jgi:tetratricopeptide (TPR) repeat protein